MANRKKNNETNKQAPQEQTPPDTENIEQKTEDNPQLENEGDTRNTENDIVLVSLKHPQGISFTMPDRRIVLIAGNAENLRGKRKGILPEGGFGLTPVSKDDWEYIRRTYGGMNIFKNGLIFASGDYKDAGIQQTEHDEIKSGLEPVNVGQGSSVDALKQVDKV